MGIKRSREDRLIETLFARHAADGREVLIGPGDDAALLRCPPGEELLITTDTLNEGVHFPAGTPADSIGHRALAVSLSDLASMAARPLWAVVTLSVPEAEEGWLSDFADGLFALADEQGVRVVGGDFVRGPLSVTVTAHGSALPGAALSRNGANAGDGIWVTGHPGEAAAGLKLLQQSLCASTGRKAPLGGRARPGRKAPLGGRASPPSKHLLQRFCYPQPRLKLGQQLSGIASACMDLSDGLITDLPRLLRSSQLQGRVEAEKLPLSAALQEFAEPEEALRLALAGGDDYELCFTAPAQNEYQLKELATEELPITRIGELSSGEGLKLTRGGKSWHPPDPGFRHFG